MKSNSLRIILGQRLQDAGICASLLLFTGLGVVGCTKSNSAPASVSPGIESTITATDPAAIVGTVVEVDTSMSLLAVSGIGSQPADGTVFVIIAPEASKKGIEPIAHAAVVNRVGSEVHMKFEPASDAKGKKARAPKAGDLAVRLSQ